MRHKILFNFSIILVFGLSVIMMNGCEGKKQIEGIVQDIFGNSIEGVFVQVLKSTYSTKTDKNGHYSIRYEPGTFTIKYSKPGFTTHKLDLTIQSDQKVPTSPIKMFPIPESEGMYYIGEKTLMKINPAIVKMKKKEVSIFHEYHYLYYVSSKGTIKISSGTAKFIDTYTKPLAFAKLGDKGSIQHYGVIGSDGMKYFYNGFIKDESYQKIGEEKLAIRTVELKPGNYAWIELSETFSLGTGKIKEPSENSPCFPFSVESVSM